MTVSSPSAIITTRDVCLTLPSAAGPVAILKDVTLTIPRGMAVAIVGPSGSGKSSLMAILSGLEQATSGRVEVDGADLAAMNEDALARFRRGRIGIILQSFHLVPTMTALENVAVPLELMGRRDAFSAARSELAAVGLGHRVDHYPAQLSGGEQQRVAIARAVAKRPDVLLCDEPTGALDCETGKRVLEVLARANQDLGTTTAIITHNAAIAAMADRVVRMRSGAIVEEVRNSVRVPASSLEW